MIASDVRPRGVHILLTALVLLLPITTGASNSASNSSTVSEVLLLCRQLISQTKPTTRRSLGIHASMMRHTNRRRSSSSSPGYRSRFPGPAPGDSSDTSCTAEAGCTPDRCAPTLAGHRGSASQRVGGSRADAVGRKPSSRSEARCPRAPHLRRRPGALSAPPSPSGVWTLRGAAWRSHGPHGRVRSIVRSLDHAQPPPGPFAHVTPPPDRSALLSFPLCDCVVWTWRTWWGTCAGGACAHQDGSGPLQRPRRRFPTRIPQARRAYSSLR